MSVKRLHLHSHFLDQVMSSVYSDTTPHPATPTKWKYKAIYRVDDAQVGLWSAEVSVVVGG